MANNKEQLFKSVLDMKKAMADFFDAYTDMLMALPVFEMTELAETVGTLETAGTLETPKTSEKVVPVKKSTTKKSKVEKQEVDEVDEVDETSDETDDIYTKEALDGKKYNELKKIAKEVGVSAKGDRETLIDNILGASEQIEEDFDEDDEEETTLEDVEDEDDTDEDDGEEEDVEAEPIDDEESLAEEIEDRSNTNMTITKTINRLGTVFFLFVFNIGISIFVFLLTGIMIFSQVLFIIYAMFLPVSFILSMIPSFDGM